MLSKQAPVRAGVGSTVSLIAPDEYHVPKKTAEPMAVSLHIYSGEMERCDVYEPQRNDWHERTERALRGPDQLTAISGLATFVAAPHSSSGSRRRLIGSNAAPWRFERVTSCGSSEPK